MAHYKNQRGSAGEKVVEIYFLMKGVACFAPSAVNSNRDLVIQVDDNFYGVQVKSAFKGFTDKGRQARYKFNFSKKTKLKYDENVCQVFALVCLQTNYIYFMKNEGQTTKSISVSKYSEELQENSYLKLMKDLQITKGI